MNKLNQKFITLNDDQWLQYLKDSINSPLIDGIRFPDFPSKEIQNQFVGSSYEHALTEASVFYRLHKGYSSALGMSVNLNSSFLDFGVGWGRFSRVIAKDVNFDGLHGVDIDQEMIDFCNKSNLPGIYKTIESGGYLDYPDEYFSHIIAYSVFTHLPENLLIHWLSEISRVSKSGAVFCCTVEPPRFIDFINKTNNPSDWHKSVNKALRSIDDYNKILEKNGFLYIPTGGGGVRTSNIYGDAVITKEYVNSIWSKYFNIIDYIDEPARYWQAVVVLQKY